jgi:hypothetical protein
MLSKNHRLRVLRKTFGPKRNKVTGCWRKLPNNVLHNFSSSSNLIRTIKSKMMKLAGHIVRLREIEKYV